MAMLTSSVEIEQVVALAMVFIVVKLSSIKTGQFNIPHVLLNDLLLLFPTVESLEAMNPKRAGKRVKKSMKDAPIVRKHKTVGDRVNAMEFEVEKVQQGMLLKFAGWEIYDNMVLFCVVSVLGFMLIEGWRFVDLLTGLNPTFSGGCDDRNQIQVLEAAASRRQKYEIFTWVVYASLSYAYSCPHQFMYSRLKSYSVGVFMAFWFLLYANTPPLEAYLDLPISSVIEDITVRIALFMRMVGTAEVDGGWLTDGTLRNCVTVGFAWIVISTCAGFTHSLSQFSRVSCFILKKKNKRLNSYKFGIALASVIPLFVLMTYVLNPQVKALPASKVFNLSPVHLRAMLGVAWCWTYFGIIHKHLQFYLEQAVQDCTVELRKHTVDPEKVRTHFYQRSTLLVYSSSQFFCFGCYIVVIILLAAQKSGLGTLGHSRPFELGSFVNGPDSPPVLARSAVYDIFQQSLVGKKKGMIKKWCDPPPFGAYEVEGGEGGEGTDGRWGENWWNETAGTFEISLKDLWNDEEIKKVIEESGGFAKAIVYHNVDFDEERLIWGDDKKKAKALKETLSKVRALLFSMVFYTIVSPPNWVILADAMAGLLCVLWCAVYVGGIVGYMWGGGRTLKNSTAEVDMNFDFEIEEVDDDSSKTKKD